LLHQIRCPVHVTKPKQELLILEYIKTRPECSFLDIKKALKLQETELFEVLKDLKQKGEIFEPIVDKYVVV